MCGSDWRASTGEVSHGHRSALPPFPTANAVMNKLGMDKFTKLDTYAKLASSTLDSAASLTEKTIEKTREGVRAQP